MENYKTSEQKINDFLDLIGRQIYTESEARAVTLELRDHIETLSEDYIENGYERDKAVERSLRQMGNPSEIGQAFNDPQLAQSRQHAMIGLKCLSACCVVFCVLWIGRLAGISWKGGFHFLMTHPVGVTDVLSNDGSVLIDLFNVVNILFATQYVQNRSSLKGKWLGLELVPLLIVWPVRKKIDKVIIFSSLIFLGPFFSLFFLPSFDNGFNAVSFVNTFIFLLLGAMVPFTYLYSEKYRMPKAVVLAEGLLIRDQFVSWTAMDKIKWRKNHHRHSDQNSVYYIVSFENSKHKKICHSIEVSETQKNVLKSLLRGRV